METHWRIFIQLYIAYTRIKFYKKKNKIQNNFSKILGNKFINNYYLFFVYNEVLYNLIRIKLVKILNLNL